MIVSSNIDNTRSKIAVFFSDQDVGFDVTKYILDNHPTHIKCVITTGENEIAELTRSYGCETLCMDKISDQNAQTILGEAEFIFLAWWPNIIPHYIINSARTAAMPTYILGISSSNSPSF